MSQTQVQAAPANGLDFNFDALGGDFHMPGFGLLTELVDSLSGPANEAAPKAAKLDNVPSFAPSVPAMRM